MLSICCSKEMLNMQKLVCIYTIAGVVLIRCNPGTQQVKFCMDLDRALETYFSLEQDYLSEYCNVISIKQSDTVLLSKHA